MGGKLQATLWGSLLGLTTRMHRCILKEGGAQRKPPPQPWLLRVKVLGESRWLVLRGSTVSKLGGGSRGARIFRGKEHVTPRVFWIASLCLHVEYPRG